MSDWLPPGGYSIVGSPRRGEVKFSERPIEHFPLSADTDNLQNRYADYLLDQIICRYRNYLQILMISADIFTTCR